jgi:hypothetical protein
LALTFARLALTPGRIADDLSNHQRAPGFFTRVAGWRRGMQTAVVGAPGGQQGGILPRRA